MTSVLIKLMKTGIYNHGNIAYYMLEGGKSKGVDRDGKDLKFV
jgi:hypothetical protein